MIPGVAAADGAALLGELLNEGIAHHIAGRFAEADALYARIIALAARHADAWRLRGVLKLQTGDYTTARGYLEEAIALEPRDAAAHAALGNVGEAQGDLALAARSYAAACALEPGHPVAAVCRARVALARDNPDEAIDFAQAALDHGRAEPGLLRTLGAARVRVRDYVGAVSALAMAVAREPHADAFANLAAAYLHLHDTARAIDAGRAALALDPAHLGTLNNLGIAHKAEGSFDAALCVFERAVELGSADAHVNLGTTYLLLDAYERGWPHYGWETAERRANPASRALPMWNGESVPGSRLLVWPEQGIGDTIQMVRFLARARRRVGSITLACPPGTLDLLRTVAGVDAVIDAREPVLFADFDWWLPTIRLPVIFDVNPATIPTAPYLTPEPVRIARFADGLRARGPLRIGLVWSGSPGFAWNAIRSCALADLAPLNELRGVCWFALQQGAATAEQAFHGMHLVPINADVADFADTAAILAQLDLLITVDTSVAHLAGALGTPTFVMLSHQPDWRWGRSGAVCAWYPTLRLFRKASAGPWTEVVAEILTAVRELQTTRVR
jgi:tetratricopeptide (TPR) repeat protein